MLEILTVIALLCQVGGTGKDSSMYILTKQRQCHREIIRCMLKKPGTMGAQEALMACAGEEQ